MATTEKKVFSTLDIYLSAFLALHGISPKLEIHNGRVTFNFVASDELYEKALDYNSNSPVPVASFVTSVKALRGQMLTMRDKR
ncbi:MAG: DUF5659 domain-containing protein [Nitrospirae bacterium]|nr:DUF5659 domain-containing protein [Nitrospirota bacterium]MCL5236331.1 DUF5659 domain-containing protein [Nitrospirota bacterium]